MAGKGKGGRGKGKGKSTSRSAKAGLQFPVGCVARYMRNMKVADRHCGKNVRRPAVMFGCSAN